MNSGSPTLATDCVIFKDDGLVLIRRGIPPFEGQLALPGGGVEVGETVEEACKREVKEETSLDVDNLQLVGVYSDPKRDPRGHVVSIVFLAREVQGELKAGDDASDVSIVSDWEKEDLAFDHGEILGDAMKIKSTSYS